MKKIIFYGNCHLIGLKSVLKQIKEFNSNYEIIDIKPIQEINDIVKTCEKYWGMCDVFVHQSIQINNKYGKEFASANVLRYLKKDCVVVACPNLYGMPKFLFPMYTNYECFYSVLKKRGALFYRDCIIDELYAQGVMPREIAKKYESYCSQKLDLLDGQYDQFWQKLTYREKEWDIPIGKFIRDNYKQHQLFFDPNHPSSYLLKYYASELLKILNVSFDSDEIKNISINELDRMAMPLMNVICNHFDIHFRISEIRKKGAKLRFRPMDIKEYVFQYCALEWQNVDLKKQYRIRSFVQYVSIQIFNIPTYVRLFVNLVNRINNC